MRSQQPRTFVVTGARSTGVAAARRFVRQALDGHVPTEVVADMALVTSELVSNAVRHGSHVPLEITVETDGRVASVTIEHEHDHLTDIPPVADWTIADPGRAEGRGLGIVRALCDGITIAQHGETLSITASRRASADIAPIGHGGTVAGSAAAPSAAAERGATATVEHLRLAVAGPNVIEVVKRGSSWVSATNDETIARAATKRQVLRETMARIRRSDHPFVIRIHTATGRLLREQVVPFDRLAR